MADKKLIIPVFILLLVSGLAAGCIPSAAAVASKQGPVKVRKNPDTVPLIHIPYEQTQNVVEDRFNRMSIFWFGQVTLNDNYTDARIGFNDQALFIHLTVFDHDLYHAESPAPSDLTLWDSAAIYIQPSDSINALSTQAVQFIVQASPGYEPFAWYQTANRWNGKTWFPENILFASQTGWRGSAFDDQQPDMGWNATLQIPFISLGLADPPEIGTEWRMGVELFDRDSREIKAGSPQVWPEGFLADQPNSWGKVSFGRQETFTELAITDKTLNLRQGVDSVTVQDAGVGGSSNCGEGLDFWTEWGKENYAKLEGAVAFTNIQNQRDVADWPCFSKFYITFPLDSLPRGTAIRSAYLQLFMFGNAGMNLTSDVPYRSLIQVFTTHYDWDPNTITWNNAPPPNENISLAEVGPVQEFTGWPGIPQQWDVTQAAQLAQSTGQPLRLILYSADGAYHSGKYFSTSDAPDWNSAARPELIINLAPSNNPVP